MDLSERAELNLELDHQEGGKWLMVVEQARAQLERENNSSIFGTSRAKQQQPPAKSPGRQTPGFATDNPVAAAGDVARHDRVAGMAGR